jgi:hypothetical protein
MTWAESHDRVYRPNVACLDLLALACGYDYGELDFDDPRRSIGAVELAALRLIEEHGWEDGVAALAMMAASLLGQSGDTESLLDYERACLRRWAGSV